MLFNSYEFIFAFLPITFFAYFYLNKKRLTEAAKGVLVFSSLFFYSWWNIDYLPIILTSMLFNYMLGVSLTKNVQYNKTAKKTLLIFGITLNLLILGYFKYTDFLILNVNYVFDIDVSSLDLLLPLAISFFTFQQIAYLVDSYRGETKEYDFLNYAVFVAFFPQLIAGPIVHHKEMMPQFANLRNKVLNYKNIILGLFIFSIGLFKKVVIADTFAHWATIGFDEKSVLTFYDAWGTSLSYTFQLYFDFSGYTDMAIGAALLFNIKLPLNFNSPYKALDIQDFWRRWHITLSRFLRDYVYIPLGGNRTGELRVYSNLMLTFIIGGLWHGAGWTFIFWGFLHGGALILHRAWKKLGFTLNKYIAWFLTFNFINISWVFFRAKEWSDANKVLNGMFGFNGVAISNNFASFLNYINPLNEYFIFSGQKTLLFIDIFTLEMIVFSFIVISLKNSNSILESTVSNRKTIAYAFISGLSVTVINLSSGSEFLYFNF